jgi:hypothetical protein
VVLQTLCKTEAANRPCPRIVLVCCTALVTGGLSAEGLFQQEASEDLVHFLFGAFEEGLPRSLPALNPYMISSVADKLARLYACLSRYVGQKNSSRRLQL